MPPLTKLRKKELIERVRRLEEERDALLDEVSEVEADLLQEVEDLEAELNARSQGEPGPGLLDSHPRRWALSALGVTLAAVLLIVLSSPSVDILPSAAEPDRALETLPQRGLSLGRADAPVEVEVLADPSAPATAALWKEAIRPLIAERIRSGEVRFRFSPWAVGEGPVPSMSSRALLAAAAEDRAWSYLSALAATEGDLSEGRLRDLADAAGLDQERFAQLSGRSANGRFLRRTERRARKMGLVAAPVLIIHGPGGGKRIIETPTPSELRSRLPFFG